MPRKPRMYMAVIPCHVVQRGNNRDATFYSDDDYQFYLACLEDGMKRYRVAVHAFVLMTNHVHLLMTPNDNEGISRLMQSIGLRYVQYVNKTYQLWGLCGRVATKPAWCKKSNTSSSITAISN